MDQRLLSDQCRVCVPLKVSPETNNVRVRQAIQSSEINKYCLIPVQTEYCCRLKKKELNDHIHMHQPRRELGSFQFVTANVFLRRNC